MTFADQEQAERRASKAWDCPECGVRCLHPRSVHTSDFCTRLNAERECDQLRADLERVTAEREAAEKMAEVAQKATAHYIEQIEAERDAMREVVKAAEGLREAKEAIKRRGWAAHLQEADAYQAFFKALARLDATRKATTDATEEGKPD